MTGAEYLTLISFASGSTLLFGAVVYYLTRPSSH